MIPSFVLVAATALLPPGLTNENGHVICVPLDRKPDSMYVVQVSPNEGTASFVFAGRLTDGKVASATEAPKGGTVLHLDYPWEEGVGRLGPGGKIEVVLHLGRDGKHSAIAAFTEVRDGRRQLHAVMAKTELYCGE